jgi:hypothetical protein
LVIKRKESDQRMTTSAELRERLLDGDDNITLADIESAERAERQAALEREAGSRRAARKAEAERQAALAELDAEVAAHWNGGQLIRDRAATLSAALADFLDAVDDLNTWIRSINRREHELGETPRLGEVRRGGRVLEAVPISALLERVIYEQTHGRNLSRTSSSPSANPSVDQQIAKIERNPA